MAVAAELGGIFVPILRIRRAKEVDQIFHSAVLVQNYIAREILVPVGKVGERYSPTNQ